MPKGGFVGQGFCGFLPHIYANVVIVQHEIQMCVGAIFKSRIVLNIASRNITGISTANHA